MEEDIAGIEGEIGGRGGERQGGRGGEGKGEGRYHGRGKGGRKGMKYMSVFSTEAVYLCPPAQCHTYLLPGSLGLSIAPITASVARVAFSGSDSNHLSRMYLQSENRAHIKWCWFSQQQ